MTYQNARINGAGNLLTTFHGVESLIQDDQQLVTVGPDTRIIDALKLMDEHSYSQLPIVIGDVVLGVFSYRSFSSKALSQQKRNRSNWIGNLLVEDFMEQFEYVDQDEDWSGVRPHLDNDDAFFVGRRRELVGMVTTMDVFDYFYDIASPFILLGEIELSLREIISTCIGEADLEVACERSLSTLYGTGQVPNHLNEMTFDNHVQIICNKRNWSHFMQIFGNGNDARKKTEERLNEVCSWRNIVFHFRRRLEDWERERLEECREWLRGRVLAFESDQQVKAITPEPVLLNQPPSRPAKKSSAYHERLARIKSQHPRAYESWTTDEEDLLRLLLSKGKTVKQIATQLQRQTGAIRSRINKLGLD